MNATQSKILYVDDDSDDCTFLKASLDDSGRPTDLVWMHDGEDAVEYLQTAASDALPSLIVLDLNMPRWNGQKTLSQLKANPSWATIPVVILSTSDNETEREDCRRLGAVSFFRKPYRFDEYKPIVAGLFSAMQA